MSVSLYEAVCSNCRHLEGDHLLGEVSVCDIEGCQCSGWKFASPDGLLDEVAILRTQVAEKDGDIADLWNVVKRLEQVSTYWMMKADREEEHNATLEVKLAEAKRPEMVRELPKEEGWYWHALSPTGRLRIVNVYTGQFNKLVFSEPGMIGALPIDFHLHNDQIWSAKPIPCDPLPKEEEGKNL